MGIIKNLVVDIPKCTGITINWADRNKVIYSQGYTRDEKGNPKRIGAKTIGYALDKNKMNPNDNYGDFFPNEWKTITGEVAKPDIRKFGLYLAISKICEKHNISSTLSNSIRSDYASAVLDFATYSIMFRDAVIEHFQASMEEQVLFSGEAHNKDYYYALFGKEITEGHTYSFRKAWAKECISQGDNEIWLCIDGSNDDCECKGVEFVERGFAKSHRNTTLVGFSYAVTEEGKPVTYEMYRGGLVDAVALKALITSMEEYGFKVKGVIIDRGYCYYNVIEYLRIKSISFIIMLKSNVSAYATLLTKYGNTLRLMPGDMWIEGTTLYGTSEKQKLYKGSKVEDTVYLYYDCENSSGRISTLLKKINKTLFAIRKAIKEGKSFPVPDKELKSMLIFEYAEEENKKSEINNKESLPTDDNVQENSPASVNLEQNIEAEEPVPKDQHEDDRGQTGHSDEIIDVKKDEEEMLKEEEFHDEDTKQTVSTDVKDSNTSRNPVDVRVDRSKLQLSTDKKGFFAIASSESLSAYDVYVHYSSRDASETTYMIFKCQEGFKEIRMHKGNGIHAKFMVGFITTIIRYYLEKACLAIDLPTNEAIRKLNLIHLRRLSDDFSYADETDSQVKKLLSKLEVEKDWGRRIIKLETDRINGNSVKLEKKKPGPKLGSHHRKFDKDGNEIKIKPGPKLGSHHKKKYNKDGSLRKKPGPKPGATRKVTAV